jgi:hypothetical protein
MATLKLNTITALFQGKISGLVIAKHKDGLILRRRPRPRTEDYTDNQKAEQTRFALAVAYARAVVADPERRRIYAAAALQQHRRIYGVALADFLRPPVIHEIDPAAYGGQPGDVIQIQATDDFQIDSVHVALTDVAGATIEAGAANTSLQENRWAYKACLPVPPGQIVIITATARDHAANVAAKGLWWIVGGGL